MEHPSVASRRKKQKVYTVMYGPTRARLKVIATIEGIYMPDLLETIVGDYIRAWEKLHKFNLEKIAGLPSKVAKQGRAKPKAGGRKRAAKPD